MDWVAGREDQCAIDVGSLDDKATRVGNAERSRMRVEPIGRLTREGNNDLRTSCKERT